MEDQGQVAPCVSAPVALLVDALVGSRLTYRPPTERSTTRVSVLSRLRGPAPASETSLDERLNAALATSASVISQFEEAADALDAASAEAENVVALAQQEIDNLESLQDVAFEEISANRTVAARLRGLVA